MVQCPILVKLEYVGWVEKILALNYGVLNIVVLLCNWVKENCVRINAIVKQNEYGFIFVNFAFLIPILDQSFAFPTTCRSSFFLSDPKEKGWKIVLWKEPCRR
jgi:hypothetical protein